MLTSKRIKKRDKSPLTKNILTKSILRPTPELQDFKKLSSILDFQNLKPISAPSFYKNLPGTKTAASF